MKTSEILNLYRMMIIPILLYNCEGWGPATPQHVIENTLEIFHREMLRRILGVGKKCPKAAVYCELGEFPLSLEIKLRTFKFLLQAKDFDEKRNCWLAFKHAMTLECTYRNSILSLFHEDLGLDLNSFINEPTQVMHEMLVDQAKHVLQIKYQHELVAEVYNNAKLGFFTIVNERHCFGFKSYLDVVQNRYA